MTTILQDQDTVPAHKAVFPPVPAPPKRDVRWELAAALRHFGRLGYEFGFNGHVSARAPEAPGHYWVNPFGVSISAVTAADFVLVNGSGEIVQPAGSRKINGFSGNLALHEAIPEAAVAVHLHTPRGFEFSSLGEPLKAYNTDAALIVNLVGITRRISGDESGPTNVDLAREGNRIILQQGHGFVTWGSSVAEAAFYLWAAERAAETNLRLRHEPNALEIPTEKVQWWTLRPDLAQAHFEPAFTLAEAEGLR